MAEADGKTRKAPPVDDDNAVDDAFTSKRARTAEDTGGPRVRAQAIVIGDITRTSAGPGAAEVGDGLTFWKQSLCITDATQPDNPIIVASEEFVRQTGYDLDDIVGQNCRFLQGKGKPGNPHTHKVLHDAMKANSRIIVDIQNFRRDGTPFWNRLLIRPLKDQDGTTQFFIGVQTPIPAEEVTYVGQKLEETAAQLRDEDAQAAILHDAEVYNTIDALRAAVKHDRKAIKDAVNLPGRKDPVWYKVRVRAIPEMTPQGTASHLWLGYSDPSNTSGVQFLGEFASKEPEAHSKSTFSSVMPRIGRALAACLRDISHAYSTASDASDASDE
eukprot:m.20246 g.20246  ORF g.20246 m.20246 type:complete len:329 (+) comp6118_c0_seq1:799-1785(+)